MGKKIGRILLKILGGILVLLVVLLLLLRLPIVQTKIAQFVTKKLSKQLETKVSIDKVAMNFVDEASVKGIYIEDQNQDTLLYAKEISVDIAFFKLLKRIVEVDQASIDTGVIKISENQDSVYNFQFIIDAFASSDTTTTTNDNPILIDLDLINISNIRASADLLASDNQLYFDDLAVKISKFDLVNEVIVVDKIDLDGLFAESLTEPTDGNTSITIEENEEETDLTATFPLSSIPFDLTFKAIEIGDAQLSLKEKGFEPADTFNAKYIDINQLQLLITDLHLNQEELDGNIEELSLNLNNEFSLESFNTKLAFSDDALSIKDLEVKLPNSQLNASMETGYQNFAALTNLSPEAKVNLELPKVRLSLRDLEYFVSAEALGPFKNQVLKANGSAKGTIRDLKLNSIHVEVGNTMLDANGRLVNITAPEKLGIRNFTAKAKADYEEYSVFISNDTLRRQLQEIGDIQLSVKGDGNMKSMLVENLEIYTESLAEAKFSGTLQNLTNTEALQYDVRIHHITTGYKDAAIFVDSLPDIVKKFDTISYVGRAEGDIYDIALDGGFQTSLGDMETDISIAFTPEYDDAVYEGRLALENFQLGELLDNDSLGLITMEVELDGSGLETSELESKIDALITEVDFNGYTYQNIDIDGYVDGLEFSGEANVDDENIRLDFEGLVDMNDSIPVMNFDLALDTLNLQKLNLSDSLFQIQLDINADITGLNLDDADGELIIKNINLIKKNKQWSTDSISLLASKQDRTKGIYLTSDFIDATIEGDYKISLLPDIILDFLDQYFPLKNFLGRTAGEDKILDPEEKQVVRNDVMEAEISVYEVEELARFFDFPLDEMDTMSLDFTLDIPNNLTEFEFDLPSITYDGFYVENIRAIANNNPDLIKSNLSIDSVSLTESVHLGGVNLDMIFREQSAMISALIRNQKDEKSLGFSTRIRSQDSTRFSVDFIRDFILNNQKWSLNQESSVILDGSQFKIPPINLNNGAEAFNIAGSNQKIDLGFTDFNLNNFIEIVGIDSLDVRGLINGNLEVGLDDETPISGDLLINNIRFNEFDIGDLTLDARKEGQDVSAVMSLKGEEVNMDGDVEYDLSSSYLFGKVLIERLNLAPLNPLVNSYARDLEGSMQGYLAIDGQLTDPLITGALYFQEVEAFIVDLATVYKIKEGKINVTDGTIKPDVTLEDKSGRLSNLEGAITHDFFTDIKFDLDFNAEEFMFLNSKQNKREFFYGTFVGRVKADITGTADLPIITADISALKETDFTIQLLSSAAVLTQENYMIFYDGSEIDSEEAIDSISRKAYEPNTSIELNLTLSASDDALFHVIVDPVTGDRLDIRGNTDLIVTIPADGGLSIIGEYVVSEGSYRVSYENTIRRTFALDAGSRLVFQGDPYNARLDMRAIYAAEVGTSALLQNSGNDLGDNASARVEVNVVLSVEGTLSNPELSFDIRIPESGTSPVGNAINDALSQLRQNETQLLEQVGSIILFNSFIGGSTGGNISSVGTATAVNSVGNLINNQLNKLASRADGFEIDFNIDQYEDIRDEGGKMTEFGIGLQQKLFNDRLIISAGGNANLETGRATDNNFSSFAGDFVIQYLLTDSGNFRVKIFQKSDFNALDNSNIWKTGIGLTYKTKFGQIKPKE